MSVLAIILSLLLEQWRPLSDRAFVLSPLARGARWLERTFNAGEASHGVAAWLVAVVPALVLAVVVHRALASVNPLLGMAFDVAALYLTLGFRQFSHYFTQIHQAIKIDDLERARELISTWRGEPVRMRSREEVIRLAIEEALIASHRHVFAVLLWYVLLPGPSGAILYRMAAFLRVRWSASGSFGHFASRALHLLEWPAVRLTAVSFAVVGDFEDTVFCWRTQAHTWDDPDHGLLLAAGAGAMGVRLGGSMQGDEGAEPRPELGVGESADGPYLDSTVGLLWRALVVWVFFLLLISAAAILA